VHVEYTPFSAMMPRRTDADVANRSREHCPADAVPAFISLPPARRLAQACRAKRFAGAMTMATLIALCTRATFPPCFCLC